MTNDRFRLRVISGKVMHRNQQGADGPKDRRQLLKYAIFYLVIAAILVVTNQTAKNLMSGANQSQSLSNLHIDLSVVREMEQNRVGSNAGARGTYVVRFRLTNQGNQPIFYPAAPNTNRPLGHVVYRIVPQSDWKPLSESAPSASTRAQLNGHIAWIEMPPGGWVDGEYEDPGSPAGDHAYELEVKVATDGTAKPLISGAYVVKSK